MRQKKFRQAARRRYKTACWLIEVVILRWDSRHGEPKRHLCSGAGTDSGHLGPTTDSDSSDIGAVQRQHLPFVRNINVL